MKKIAGKVWRGFKESWHAFAVSQIGPAHIKNNMPNQDSVAFLVRGGACSCAVCDGLGSKKFAHVGSRALARTFVEMALELGGAFGEKSAFEARLKEAWERRILPFLACDAATTLLGCVVRGGFVHVCSVGDGAVVVLKRDGGNEVLTQDKDGFFANLTCAFGGGVNLSWHKFCESEVMGVVMFTDGIADDLMPEKVGDFARCFVGEFAGLNAASRERKVRKVLKEWVVKGHSDDKTILVLTRGRDETFCRRR